MKKLVVLMFTALLIPFSMSAEPTTEPKEQKPADGGTDLLNAALEVARATTAPRITVETVRRPSQPPPVVIPPQPVRTSTVVIYDRPGYIAPPTSYHQHRTHGPTKVIGRDPHKK